MKLPKIRNTKQALLLCISFLILFTSYTTNFGNVAGKHIFYDFERRPEGLVIGRLSRSAQDGAFSYGGLNGLNYIHIYTEEEKEENIILLSNEYNTNLALQHDLYLLNKPLPKQFMAYKSQSGGQGIVFSVLQKFTPFDGAGNLKIFRGLNALLLSLCFTFFIAWVCRGFGLISGVTTFVLLFLSPWLTLYGHSLWWVAWNFYIPFLVMLLILEKRHNKPDTYSDKKICVFIFVAVFLKCFFSGFEFITTTLVSAICPIVYYYVAENKSLKQFIRFSLKIGASMILAVLAEMLVLLIQLINYTGSWTEAVGHLFNSYTRRTGISDQISGTYGKIFGTYFKGNAFSLGFLEKYNFSAVYFGILLLIFGVFGIVIYLLNKRQLGKERTNNIALIITTIFSILAPLSWFVIFKEHSSQHPHIDFFVWYLPTLPLGFVMLGQGISMIYDRLKLWYNFER